MRSLKSSRIHSVIARRGCVRNRVASTCTGTTSRSRHVNERRPGETTHLITVALLFFFGISDPSAATTRYDACFVDAGARYRIAPDLLQAIARTESGLDPAARNANRNGSEDVGLMQINSRWLPRLARHGIGAEDLWDPCVSIHVGAWVLAQNIRRYGYTWTAVGAYNESKRSKRGQTRFMLFRGGQWGGQWGQTRYSVP